MPVARSHRFVQYTLPFYSAMVLYDLYVIRYSIFALFVNPLSIPFFLMGVLVMSLRVGGLFVGRSYLKTPRLTKLVFFVIGLSLVFSDFLFLLNRVRHYL